MAQRRSSLYWQKTPPRWLELSVLFTILASDLYIRFRYGVEHPLFVYGVIVRFVSNRFISRVVWFIVRALLIAHRRLWPTRTSAPLRVADVCLICHDAPVAWTALPCNHASICASCIDEMNNWATRCTLCRATVDEYERIFA